MSCCKKQRFCLIMPLFRWPLITENTNLSRDPQLSNLQHAVGYFKDGVFQIEIIPAFYHSKEELYVEQCMQFCFANSHFKETHFVNFFTDPELSSSLYMKPKKYPKSIISVARAGIISRLINVMTIQCLW